MAKLHEYEVMAQRFIDGHLRTKGERVAMTARAAQYYAEPYGTGLKLASQEADAAPKERLNKEPKKRG